MSISRIALLFAMTALIGGSLHGEQVNSDKFVEPSSYFDATDLDASTDGANTSAVNGQPGCNVDLNDCNKCCAPLWVVNVGAIALQRGTPHSSALISGPGGTVLDANAFKFNYAVGADISAIRQVSRYDLFDAVDFRYFGIQSSQADASVPGVIWALPTTPPLVGVGPIDASYHTKLFSSEFNLRRYTPGGRVTLLAGVRWIQMSEQLNFTFIAPVATGFTTLNNMLGTQVGADISLWNRGGPLSVVCTSKAGVYGNSSLASSNVGVLGTSDSVTRLAFVGDLNVNALYQWGEHIAFRGGWQLLWIEGAATATRQIGATNFISGNGINTAGNAFYQGAMGSVTFMW
jgi:hypothetical protein